MNLVEELTRELHPPLTVEEALVEADRCVDCVGPYAEAPCAAVCPADIGVAQVKTDWEELLTRCDEGGTQ